MSEHIFHFFVFSYCETSRKHIFKKFRACVILYYIITSDLSLCLLRVDIQVVCQICDIFSEGIAEHKGLINLKKCLFVIFKIIN